MDGEGDADDERGGLWEQGLILLAIISLVNIVMPREHPQAL